MNRHSAGFEEVEQSMLVAYATPGTELHRALRGHLPGMEVSSISSAIRALVLVGHHALEEERLRQAYDTSMAAGEFDGETRDWYRAVDAGIVSVWAGE